MSLPNIGGDPHGPIKDVLKIMMIHFIGVHRVTTDEAIHTALNKFMTLGIADMNTLLRELCGEKKIQAFPLKVPVGAAGTFGHMSVYTLPDTLPA